MASTTPPDTSAHNLASPASEPSVLMNLIHDLACQVSSLRDQVKDATMRALVTVEQAEDQHLAHPSLYQRAHGATLANEPPGIHQLYWSHRSRVRQRQHKDEVAVEKLRGDHNELVKKSSTVLDQVSDVHKEMLKESKAVRVELEQVGGNIESLEKIVNCRIHVVGDGEGE
ncbi:uncharacterized protein RCC_06506 [Ramularia collo-cygni]|uniref:Uncharacterized protein n=1 Tax=Ramularia collo-cygni TaxID=112498 RepID=A0A2D3UYV5_9PEZI|nr:uncharacterized protein RCC_06506 [Ramularia collo-cygni]CZT20648.1 uncharacterized protein RCC_06506 [Ramularia collo-cygni]